jgi:hypothetical protein
MLTPVPAQPRVLGKASTFNADIPNAGQRPGSNALAYPTFSADTKHML